METSIGTPIPISCTYKTTVVATVPYISYVEVMLQESLAV